MASTDDEDWDARKTAGNPDTTTVIRTKRILSTALWNVNPDFIRLFLACENPLTAPSAKAGIRFTATGATLRLDAKQHLLWLAPSDSVVVLRAYRGQRLVFRHKFKAVEPPSPRISLFVGGCDCNDCRPWLYRKDSLNIMRAITMRAVPNADFAAFMPNDAHYRVARFQVTLLRQGKVAETAPGKPTQIIVSSPQGDLITFAEASQLGDQLQTDVLLVQRMTFRGNITTFPFRKRYLFNGPLCPP